MREFMDKFGSVTLFYIQNADLGAANQKREFEAKIKTLESNLDQKL